MGRLVNSVSRESGEDHATFDEGRFLQEAGQIAARLQSELTADRLRSGRRNGPESLASEYREELGVSDGHHPVAEPARARPPWFEEAVSDEAVAEERLAIYSDQPDGTLVDGHREMSAEDERRAMASLRDTLHAEVQVAQHALGEVKERMLGELRHEAAVEAERHAQESRNLQKESGKLSEWTETLDQRENRLSSRESSLDQLQEQLRVAHAATTHDLTQPAQESTRRDECNRAIIEECDRKLAELADEKQKARDEILRAHNNFQAEQQRIRQADEAEQSERERELTEQREELARERLEHDEELRNDREHQLQELNAARIEFEQQRDATAQQLEHEQREWSRRLKREQDELLALRQTVEHDVARMHADLDREQSAWESRREEMRVRMREEELAHEQLMEQGRAELSLLTERERVKLAANSHEVEQLIRETADHCELRRGELEKELLSQRTEWIDEQESERVRLEAEKATLKQSVEELQTALNERRQQHEHALREECDQVERELVRQREQQDIELTVQRQQVSEWAKQETARIEHERRHAQHERDTERHRLDERIGQETTRMEQEREELLSGLASERTAFEDSRQEWHEERGREAAIIQTGRHELERLRTRLESEQERIESERSNQRAELEHMRDEHDEQLRHAEQMHQEGLLQDKRELQGRKQLLDEKVQQTDAELTARCRQVEEELRATRELHEKQLAHDKAAFAQACARRESELEREKSELRQGREKLEHESKELASRFDRAKQQFAENVGRTRKTFEAETSRVRRQLEQERRVVRSGLNQMNAQLVSVATSLNGAPAEITSRNLNSSEGQPSTEELEFILGGLGNDVVESTVDLPLMPEFAIPPVESVDLNVDSSLDDSQTSECGSELPHVGSATSEWRVDPAESNDTGRPDMAGATSRSPEQEADEDAPTEWACIVERRTTTSASGVDGRRQALEGYRSQLGDLQSQLQELAAARESTDGAL